MEKKTFKTFFAPPKKLKYKWYLFSCGFDQKKKRQFWRENSNIADVYFFSKYFQFWRENRCLKKIIVGLTEKVTFLTQ